MDRRRSLIAICILIMSTIACSITVNLPVQRINTGATHSESVMVQKPESTPVDVSFEFGAGELRLNPGAKGALITGNATYNVPELKPKITSNGNKIQLKSGDMEIRGIPSFSRNFQNVWDLKIADTPMTLLIKAGAYRGDIDLGGLAIQSLEVDDGAADVHLDFSSPNLSDMDTLNYQTGASNVRLSGLGNANFHSLFFRGGAGNYSLDFSGVLKHDADVSVETGMSSLTLIVPKGVSARVVFKGSLAEASPHGAWRKDGDNYSLPGSGPSLNITVQMGAGNLELRNN